MKLDEAKYDDFKIFLNHLEFNYPIKHCPISDFHQWKYDISLLKEEVQINLAGLAISDKKQYLTGLKVKIESLKQYSTVTKEQLDDVYKKYNTNEKDLVEKRAYENELHVVLYLEPPQLQDTDYENLPADAVSLQYIFHNFHYGEVIGQVINYLVTELANVTQTIVEYQSGIINTVTKEQNTDKKGPKSFTYISYDTNLTAITELKNGLINSGFIASDTDLADFRKVFSGDKIGKRIVWTGSKSELYYFIQFLHNKSKKVVDLNQQQWKVVQNCFIQPGGEIFNYKTLRLLKPPSKSADIEHLVNKL